MQEDRKFEVKWRLVNSSTLCMVQNYALIKIISILRTLMPSGTIIHSWYMLTDFAETV